MISKQIEQNKQAEGQIFKSRTCGLFKVLKYNNAFDVEIEFIKTGYKTHGSWSNIKRGQVKDLYYPKVYGVGYFGEGIYTSRVNNGPQTKCYKIWKEMLGRCYCKKVSNYKTYGEKGVIVCDEWHNFQNYVKWYYTNCKNPSFCVDKDFLHKGSKIYSPKTCCFIPNEINVQLTLRTSERGNLPLGVRPCGQKFQVQINRNSKKEYLGLFNTIEDAFNKYKEVKEAYLKSLAEKYKDELTEEVYNAIHNYTININD